MSSKIEAFNKKQIINIVIMFVLFFGVQFLPPFGLVTEFGMKILGVFLGLLWGWIAVDLVWPSVLGFFILAIMGWGTPLGNFLAGISNSTVLLCFAGYTFAYAAGKAGITDAVAAFFLRSKIFVNRPVLFIIAFALLGQLMAITGAGFAAVFVLWDIIARIAKINSIPKGDKTISLLYTLIIYACFIGGNMIPYMSGTILFSGFVAQGTGVMVTPTWQYMVMGQIYVFISSMILILMSKFVFRADLSKFNLSEEVRQQYAAYKINRTQKIGLIIILIYMLMLFLPTVFTTVGFFQMLASWGLVGCTILALVCFNLLPNEEGNPICTVEETYAKGLVWAPMLLFMVTVPLASALESSDVGILATVAVYTQTLIGDMNLYVLYILIIILAGFATQFLHNVVLAAILCPILGPIVIGLGGNPITFAFVMIAVLNASYATPAASMMSAFVFGKEDIPVKHGYMYGFGNYIASSLTLIALIPLLDILFANLF